MKEIKKRVQRALSLLQNPRGATAKSIVRLVNEDEPAVSVRTILHQLHDEIRKGNILAKDGKFKLKQAEEDSYEDYEVDDMDEEDDDDDEEDEEDELDDYMGQKPEFEGSDHPKGEKEKGKEKDDKSKTLEPPKTGNEKDNTSTQPYEAKCYPCNKKKKRSSCPKKKKRSCPMKKKRSSCPKKKKRSCPMKKKRSSCPKKKKRSCPMKKKSSCPKKKKPSCPKKKPSCPSKRKPKKCFLDDEEDDREVKASSPVASHHSFDFGSKVSLRNRLDRIDLKKQFRGPRCTSMKKETRFPSKVQLPLVNPSAPSKNYDELARKTPEPVTGPLFDENKEMIVDSEMPSFSFPQI